MRVAIERDGVRGSVAGLLRVETTLDLAAMRALVAAQGLPADYVEALDADAASRVAGVTLSAPAWHYACGGWVDPRALARSWLHAAGDGVELRLGCAVASLRRVDDAWQVGDASGAAIVAAPVVVLCNGDGALARDDSMADPPPARPAQRDRGRKDGVDADAEAADRRCRLCAAADRRHGLVRRQLVVGRRRLAARRRSAPQPRPPGALLDRPAPAAIDARLGGRVGFRWTSDDRLPIVGAVPASVAADMVAGFVAAPSARLDQPRFVARAPGLFVCCALGSRGIASAAFGAEIVAASITGAPLPAEADLLDAIDPARFLSREFRRGEAARQRLAADRGQPPVGPIAGSAGA